MPFGKFNGMGSITLHGCKFTLSSGRLHVGTPNLARKIERIENMRDMRINHLEIKSDNKAKIIAATVVGLAVLAGAARGYKEDGWKGPPKPIVALNQLPQLTPPIEPGMSKPR
jgi:hypothetical protein